MKIFLVAALAALVWTGVAQAQMWPGVENTGLEAKLPTPVKVYCATQEMPGAAGWTWLQAPEIYLSRETCADLTNNVPYAYSYLTFYHEWWHQAFRETSESRTNTGAMAILRYALRHYWGFDQWKAQAFYTSVYGWNFSSGYEIAGLAWNDTDPLMADGF